MVLDDVPGCADSVVVAGSAADAHVLGHGDLHVGDVVGVPNRLEHHVGEAQGKDVLHGLLAQIVVNAEDRIRLEDFGDHPVKLLGGSEVVAKGLLDDDAAPSPLRGVGESRLGQLASHLREGLGGHRHVEGVVAAGAPDPVQLRYCGRQAAEGFGVVEAAFDEAHALAQMPPC